MKKLKMTIISLIFFILLATPINAASFSMSSSTREVSPNGTFTINVGGDCIGRVDFTISNGTLSTSNVWVEEGYTSVTVTAGASGSVTITATPAAGFSDSDANEYRPGSRTVTVNISTNSGASSSNNHNTSLSSSTKKSGDNNLTTLTIKENSLNPGFDKNQTEYSVNLSADTTKITIEATASDSKAKIEGIGEVNVNPGENNLIITVTAENGNKKTYTIKAYVDETPQVYLTYKKEKIGIVRNLSNISIPEEFNENNHTIENQTISIFTKDSIDIIYGQNESNEKNFYLFNKETNEIINKFIPLNINNKILYVIDAETKRNNTSLKSITINDTEITCYQFKGENNNYCLLTAINSDGEKVEYLYESSENTIQLFPEFLTKENFNIKNIIIYSLSGLIIIITGIIILLFIKLKKGDSNEKTK